jgi:hypothetical protein
MRAAFILAGALLIGAVQPGLAQTANKQRGVLSAEPAAGALKAGKRVLVDDGSCPAGEIKEVTGGTDKEAPGSRSRRCIKR